jgi:hypothetical protein
MSDPKPYGYVGHGTGTGNGNKADVPIASNNSLFNWKPTVVHNHYHQAPESAIDKTLKVVGVAALGVGVFVGANKLLNANSAANKEAVEARQSGAGKEQEFREEEVTMTASAQLEILSRRGPLTLG